MNSIQRKAYKEQEMQPGGVNQESQIRNSAVLSHWQGRESKSMLYEATL